MNSKRIHFTNKITLSVAVALTLGMAEGSNRSLLAADGPNAADQPKIVILDPPERDFFSKLVDYHGIKIKAHKVVADEAMYEAWRRVDMLLTNLPMVLSNLVAGGSELHIIGTNQVTTDLPEWRQDKHVPLDEYNGLTRDQRTRGMGGIVASFGEENLLRLRSDRYWGRDICIHEFTHGTFGSGIQASLRQRFLDQLKRSQEKGLWVGSYAASGNGGEFLSEMTMWYWGTHGDLGMQGAKPENGREGLKKYDPETFALVDDFYSGRIEIEKVEPRFRRPVVGTNSVAGRPAGSTNSFAGRPPRDSLPARAIVAKLTSYKTGETKLGDFYSDAGMASPADNGTNGWQVTLRENAATEMSKTAPAAEATYRFRVFFRDPRNRGAGGMGGFSGAARGTNVVSTNAAVLATNTGAAVSTNAVAGRGGRGAGGRGGGGRGSDRSLADLDFKGGVLTAFVWNN